MSNLEVIILAAGFGTRMKSSKSKVLFKLCGREMICHILQKSYEITDNVSVILSHQFDEIKEIILKNFPKTKIYKQDIENFPGTAGALRDVEFNAKKTLIICGDMPLIKMAELLKLSNGEADINLSVFNAKNPFGYGRVIIKNGEIQKIVEQKDANESEKAVNSVNAGCYCFKTEVLKQILP
ncbi:MAG: NTP transferase domain-containing protein, partial [Campylobacter sp.]|nr:NTP transferase domain-containing protein [Campylobacter sp.]